MMINIGMPILAIQPINNDIILGISENSKLFLLHKSKFHEVIDYEQFYTSMPVQ